MKRYEPLANQPPAGNRWAAVEAARKKLGWSASKLSVEAGLSRSFLNVMALRNTWNAQMNSIDKFIDALVRNGIRPEELPEASGSADVRTYNTIEAPRVLEFRDVAHERAAEILIQRGYRIGTSVSAVNAVDFEPPRGLSGGPAPAATPEMIAAIAEDGIKSRVRHGALPPEEMRLDKPPGSAKPRKPSKPRDDT